MSSELRVDKIVPTTGVPTGGGGGVTQVIFAENNTIQSFSFNNSVFDPQPVCSATITPKFNTSKILVHCSAGVYICLLYTSPSPRDLKLSRMPSSA